MIEHVYESESDEVVVEAIAAHARAEAVAASRRLAAIAELATRRLGSEVAADRDLWACDAWDSAAAEVAAELLIGHKTASAMMHQGLDLRDRLPQIGALLARGEIPARVATTATFRTGLIADEELLARVDAELAAAAARFGRLSQERLVAALDACVHRHDPDGVRRFRTAQRGCDVRFGKPDDDTGTQSVFGRMTITDAALADQLLEQLAKSVCRDDPRTHGERRAAAWAILSAGGNVLPCLCGSTDCPAPTGSDARTRYFAIHVLTDDPTAGPGEPPEQPPTPDGSGGPDVVDSVETPAADTEPEAESHPDTVDGDRESDPSAVAAPPPPACPYTSMIAGGGIVPAPLLAELRRMGVAVRPVLTAEDVTATPSYRPTVGQQRFVRTRDMTCRFPGCDHPAEFCDVDHTIAYDANGLTHPGNLKALCRKHHLLKTFWVGRGGWTDEQLADGTIVWTTPTGRRKAVPPGSRLYYPDWDTITPVPAPASGNQSAPTPETDGGRGTLTMPRRRRTRAQQRGADIRTERARNRKLDEANPPRF